MFGGVVHPDNPFAPHLTSRGRVVLDGGLATALEEAGHVLDSDLWSARVLIDRPDAVNEVHRRYLEAGADCITTASYQVSFPGLAAAGFSEADAERLLRRSSEVALEARNGFMDALGHARGGLGHARGGFEDGLGAGAATPEGDAFLNPPPLVAASVGPYGAWLADGSEYSGAYGVGRGELDTFHRRRFGILAGSGVDLLACETIPSLPEAEVLLDVLDDHPTRWAWLSFSCRDGAHLHDGSLIDEAVRLCTQHDRVAAVGVNCTAPEHIGALVERAVAATDLPVIVYPNSGERWDAAARGWSGPVPDASWTAVVRAAHDRGAVILGGCCRIGPAVVSELRSALDRRD